MRIHSNSPSHRGPAVLPVVLLLAIASAAPAAAKDARAKFKETAWDFGKVKQGEVVSHEFVFKNIGDAALLIEQVETSCGCTAALLSEKRVDPGKEGKIKASFDTRGYSGKLVKYIFVDSNDVEESRRELSVTADVEVPPSAKIELDRYNVEMGLCLEGEAPVAELQIKNVGELELRIEISHQDIQFLTGGKAVAFPLLLPTGKSADLEIRFPAQNRTGLLRDYLLIRSNDPVRSTLSVYLSRYVITKKDLRELFLKYRKVLDEKK